MRFSVRTSAEYLLAISPLLLAEKVTGGAGHDCEWTGWLGTRIWKMPEELF